MNGNTTPSQPRFWDRILFALVALGVFVTVIASLVVLSITGLLRHGLAGAFSSAPSPAQVDADVRNAALPLSDLQENLLDVLPPQKVTPGLVVCDPVTPDPSRAMFGAGCSRWLHLYAAGQGALGQTPYWTSPYRAETEMKRANLQITPADVMRLGAITGVPDVAVGTLDGTSAHSTLVYQIYSTENGKAVGKPIRLEGTDQAIVAGLPATARALDTNLSVTPVAIPTTVGLTPEQLSHLGQDSTQSKDLSDAQTSELFALSPNCPLANMIFISRGGWRYRTQSESLASHLLTQCPQNPLALSLVAERDSYFLRPVLPELARNRKDFPANYLFAFPDVERLRMTLDRAGEQRAAEITAEDAPRNPEAWLTFAYTMSDSAHHLRKGRVASDLSPAEWTILNHDYALQMRATDEAVTLDPNFGHGWARLAQAATFGGDMTLAKAAFWKALELDSDKAGVYAWGLQMFQPKWGGSPTMLNTVADKAASETYSGADDVVTVAQDLEESGETVQATALLTKAISADQAWTAREPNNGYAHWALAALFRQNKDMLGATREYRKAAELLPKDADVHYWYGECLQDREMMAQSIAPLAIAETLDPARLLVHYDYGYALKATGHYPEAEAQLNGELLLEPDSLNTHYALGELYTLEKKLPQAISQYYLAVNDSEDLWEAQDRLTQLLDQMGRYDEALAVGTEALTLKHEDPDDRFVTDIMTDMADSYLNKHNPKACIALCNQQLAIKADDPYAYENIAEAELQEGDLTDARENWKKVASLDTGALGTTARTYLSKYP